MTKVLLYSGGVDSWLIDKLWKPDVKLYVDIHGMYSEHERRLLPEDTVVVDFPFLGETEDKCNGFVPLRNLYFLMIASAFGDELCLGATAGDRGARDKTPEFLMHTEETINDLLAKQSVYEGREVRVERRFADMSKRQMLEEYLAAGGDLESAFTETFSCFNPDRDGNPCYSCKPCFRKFVTFYNAGYQFPEDAIAKMMRYIENHVLTGQENGTRYDERYLEGEDCVRAVRSLMGEG